MLKLTKTGIGLLTRLYRSVLQKCWLINIGVWALGAVGKTVSTLLPQTLRGTLNGKTFNVIEKLLQIVLASGDENKKAEVKKLLSEPLTSPSEGTSFAINAKDVLDSFSENHVFNKNLISTTALATILALGINIASTTPACAADAYSREEADASRYNYAVFDENGNLKYYEIVLDTENMNTRDNVSWEVGGFGTEPLSWNTTNTEGYGRVGIDMPYYVGGSNSATTNTQVYSYTYTKSSDMRSSWSDNANFTSDYVGANHTEGFNEESGSGYGGALSRRSATNTVGAYIENHLTVDTDDDDPEDDLEGDNGITGYALGGAIYNTAHGSIVGDFIKNYAEVIQWIDDKVYDSGWAQGGAIYTSTSQAVDISGNFIGNYTKISATKEGGGQSKRSQGGAIYNARNIGTLNANFIKNQSNYGEGGAIYNGNSATISALTGDFINNTANTHGGAIYNGNSATISALTGDFINNTANTYGGAIYNNSNSKITMLAKDRNMVFYGNKAGTAYNDIYNNGSTINLNAASGKSISFGGTITGSGGTVNINSSVDASERGGVIKFGNAVQGQNIQVYNGGTVQLGRTQQTNGTVTYGSIGSSSTLGYDNNGGNLNTITGTTEDVAINSLNLLGDMNLQLDVDVVNKKADKFSASTFNGSGNIIIDAINMLAYTDSTDEVWVNVTTDTKLKNRIGVSTDILNHMSGAANPYTSITYDTASGDLVFGDYSDIDVPVPDDPTPTPSTPGVITARQLIGTWSGGTYIKSALSTTNAGDHTNYLTVGEALTALDEAVANASGGTWGTITGNLSAQIDLMEHLDTNYSRKLTKTSTFCDSMDGKITPDLEDKTKADFERKINESPLDLVQIVKGSTDSKTSTQSASIVGVRIGGTLDGLYDNLIKKAEDPLTHSPFGSARDDNITFAAANDNTNYKQGGTMNNEANTFSETTENVPASEMHKIRQSRGISSFFRRNNEDMMEKISQSAANTQKINITTIRAA